MSDEHTDIVEIDAIAVEEWDREQHTPQQIASNLAELVKKSGLDESWEAGAKDDPAAGLDKPRTTTNTLRRTGSAPAIPSKVHKTMAMPTVAAVKPAPVASSGVPAKAQAIQTQPITSRASTQMPAQMPAQTPAQPKPKLEAKTAPTKSATKTTATRVALQKPAAAPTFAPFGNEAAKPVAKPEVAKLAPVTAAKVAPVAVAKPATPEVAKPATTAKPPAAAAKPATEVANPPAAVVKPAMPATSVPVAAASAATPPAAVANPATPSVAKPTAAVAKPVTPVKSAPVAAARPATPEAAKPAAVAKPTIREAAKPVAMTTPPSPVAAAAPAPAPVAVADASAQSARAPSTLDLPVWPPAPAGTLPRAITAEVVADAQPFDDWDEIGGATSVGTRDGATQPPRKPGEDSVIVDLNAVSKAERQPARRPQTYPILTSEQGTTTSGAFVMPTATEPQAPLPQAEPQAAQSQAAQAQAAQRDRRATERHTPPAGTAQLQDAQAQAAQRDRRSTERHTPPSVAAQPQALADRPSTAWHTPLPLAAPPPEPAPQWPSASGLEYGGAHGSAPEIPLPISRPDPSESRLARRTLLATVFPTPSSRKRGLLVAAGGLVVILVIVLVSAGGGTASTSVAASAAPHATPASHTPSTSSRPSTPTTTAATARVTVAAADPVAIPTTASDAKPKRAVPAKRRISRGKKPIIVDYDKKPDPTPEQDEALARARADYVTGNHHLFAGETDAAIAAYRQALSAYPNYVAGYRGLGLAFAQQGNRASALLAFKTYVKLAPTAKDVALIEKRIANLSLR
jgi:hypothetical protein